MDLVKTLATLQLNHYYRQSLRISKAERRLNATSVRVTYLNPTPTFSFGWRGVIYRYKYFGELTIYDLQCSLIHVWIWWLRRRIDRNTRHAKKLVRRYPQLFKKE